MMAAIALGQDVLPPPPTFDFLVFAVGMIVHFVMSIVYAVIIAFLVRSLQPAVAIAVGAGIGLAVYLVNFYGFTAVFPWFAMARNWVTIVSHLVFGAVIAWWYRAGRGTPVRRESAAY